METRALAGLQTENLRLRAELATRALDSEKFRVLFEYAADALLILGADGILDCNAAAIAMLRARHKDDVLRVHPAVLSPEVQPDGRRSLEKSVEMDRTAHTNGYHRFEWIHRRMDGEDFPVEVTLTPVTIPGERVLLVAWHDLSARKAREAVIVRQQAEIERLSLPVLAVWQGVVMIPVLGALDVDAAARLIDAALHAATHARARTVILDLTGLTRVDARTAPDLLRVVGALRLVGAQGILAGIGPAIAGALATADVPMPRLRVFACVRDAIEACVRGAL